MAIVWIGDFRCKSLQCVYEASNKTDADHFYIIDDLGGSDWTSSDAMYQLEKLCPVSSHIVIMTGLIDCVNSCIWKTVNIDKVAENYKTTIEKLKSIYNGHLFYFCSVPQVAGDYSSSFAPNGVITARALNEKIKKFNEKMKEICPATFIDCYDYISKTSLETRDGLRYTATTAKALQEFVYSQVNLYSITIGNTFMSKQRLKDEDAPNPQDESFKYWKTEYNDCIDSPEGSNSGVVLPNCTGYAWGRFYEITGERPNLSTNDAASWYSYNDGYDRGNEPKEGAVICWTNWYYDDEDQLQQGFGHVAIVEKVYSSTSIRISQSYYRDEYYDPTNTAHFSTDTLELASDGAWYFQDGGGYEFLGFIYCPQTTPVTNNTTNTTNNTRSTTTTGINAGLCTDNRYGITKAEMEPNAKYIWNYLGSRGWSKNAVAALLGNMEQESKMSPCVWETATEFTSNQVTKNADGTYTINESEVYKIAEALGRYKRDEDGYIIYDSNGKPIVDQYRVGYGLTQWTPYTKFTNWCKDKKLNFWDINSQLARLEAEVAAGEIGGWTDEDQWRAESAYNNITFKEFTTSTKEVSWLTDAFCDSYERPSSPNYAVRRENAAYWYDIISGLSPTLVGTTNTPSTSTQLRLAAFKVDNKTSTQAKLSFVTNNSTSYSYILKQGTKQIATKKADFIGGVESFTFENLIPNTKYTINLEVLGTNSTKETKELSFTTLQSYPESIRDIFLDPNLTENYKDACNSFRLIVNQPESLGYWKNNTNGYELQLYVNSELIKKKTVNKVKKLSMTDFNIAKEFGYTCKTGDNIQIGVRTWVKTDTGTVLYDANTAKVSKPVCLLNKPVKSFLNLKKD